MSKCHFDFRLASPVKFLEFSPDGHFFASAGNVSIILFVFFCFFGGYD